MPQRREKIFSKIAADLLAMSKVVFKQLQHIKAQMEPSLHKDETQEEITQNELVLDSFEVKLRRNVISAMVLYGPRASDMRKLMSYYDIAINLERMGDLMMNCNKHLSNIDMNGPLYSFVLEKIHQLVETTDTMIKNAIYSYSCEDAKLTGETLALDDVVDGLFAQVRTDIVEQSKDKSHTSEQLREILAINGLAYNIERIADNATNIVEASIYLIEGRNIQHENSKDSL